MKPYLLHSLISLYRLLLNVYPPAYRAQFADEMSSTFTEGAEEASSQGTLGGFVARELRDTPKALVNAYWDGWMMKLQNGIRILQDIASTSDLPPAPPDGRDSWRRAFGELSIFVIAALLLVLGTYAPFVEMSPGWQRDPEFLGKVIVPLTLPFLLLGLARGLPRWAYPFGGLLAGYQSFVSYQSGVWLFLFIMVLAFLALAIAEVVTNPQRSLLPLPLRRIGQSISVDWTRLSFGMFGAMPLILLMAFDDAHANNRTPYLALSALGMVVSALIYCRSRTASAQIAALLTGLTLAIWSAWMDKIAFAGGLMGWVTLPSTGSEEMFWLLKFWLQWGALIVSPILLALMGRAARFSAA
ncbi:hypothetical protein FBQ81_04215 [Chloroflexi bacterium CFX6]|nr:hypothetical protein [Chloroflexi bacterium CFX6]